MEVRQIEYGRVLLWAKLLVLEGRKRSTSIGLFFFFPLFFGTDYFERRWLSISQHFVRHLSAEIYGMKDKRCVLFCFFHPFVFFTIRFRSVTNETDLRSTCRCSNSFFFLSLARFHPYFFLSSSGVRGESATTLQGPLQIVIIQSRRVMTPTRREKSLFLSRIGEAHWYKVVQPLACTVFGFLKFCCRPGRARLIMGHDCCRRCPRL